MSTASSTFISDSLNRSRVVQWLKIRLRTLITYKSLAAQPVQFDDLDVPIYVDPLDHRGYALIKNKGRRQAYLRRIWRSAAEHLRPSLVLDVGTNYGEFLLSLSYPEGSIGIGIEANQSLRPLLERSLSGHPDRDRIAVHYALAAERPDAEATIYIDKASSGKSSALAPSGKSSAIAQSVPTISIDSLFASEERPQKTVLYKIDVEGYEPPVLMGMRTLLRQCETSLGIVEFNSAFLGRSEADMASFADKLSEFSAVFETNRNPREVTRIDNPSTYVADALARDRTTETNLILANGIREDRLDQILSC